MQKDTELREIFHFCFLEQLLRISDPKIYTLKGGVNLRFFFNSPRYSEDMDIDVSAGSVATLKKNGYKILGDDSFKRRLETYGIEGLKINDPSKAKHTETTQRFKLRIITKSGDELPTKIEFSRCNKNQSNYSQATERVNTEIARKYNRLSFLCQHYDGKTALIQKIEALAGRPETQSRDVFDIFILDIAGFSPEINTKKLSGRLLKQAQEATLAIDYKYFKDQVLNFLETDKRDLYSSPHAWSEIQERVIRILSL